MVRTVDSTAAQVLNRQLTDNLDSLLLDSSLHAVLDTSANGEFSARHPELAQRGIQIVTPLTARLLWCFSSSSSNSQSELLLALHEIVESYNLTIDADELFKRMLEIALSVTGAEGGSMMLLDAERRRK